MAGFHMRETLIVNGLKSWPFLKRWILEKFSSCAQKLQKYFCCYRNSIWEKQYIAGGMVAFGWKCIYQGVKVDNFITFCKYL